jgi:hypothetical protein
MGTLQSALTLKAVERAVEVALRAVKTEAEARQGEIMAVAQQLSEGLLQALRHSADMAERVASIGERLVVVEGELAALKAANAGAGEDE